MYDFPILFTYWVKGEGFLVLDAATSLDDGCEKVTEDSVHVDIFDR